MQRIAEARAAKNRKLLRRAPASGSSNQVIRIVPKFFEDKMTAVPELIAV